MATLRNLKKWPAEKSSLTTAQELHFVEQQILGLEEKKEALRGLLLRTLQMQGVKTIKLEGGDTYMRMVRIKPNITDASAARAWALENPEARMKIDAAKLTEVARMGGAPFVELEHTEYLTIRRAKSEINSGDTS